jgi:hypothetical protein
MKYETTKLTKIAIARAQDQRRKCFAMGGVFLLGKQDQRKCRYSFLSKNRY